MKQAGPLIDYLENFDTLLARVLITEDLALSFFLSELNPELEKSVRVHRPKTIQEAIRIARLQKEVLQEMAKKFSPAKSASFESQVRYTRSWSFTSPQTKSYPITTLQQSLSQNPTFSTLPTNSKVSSINLSSRKQISERITKGLCRFCGEKWDMDHKQQCKVWGKLTAIFSAQDNMTAEFTSEDEREQETELV